MRIKHSEGQTGELVSRRTRWLAIATGCFTAVIGSLEFGWPFAVVPGVLVLGATVQPYSPRPGRWLMWVGIVLLIISVVPIGIGILSNGLATLGSYHDVGIIGMLCASLVSFLLVIWCAVVLVMDALRFRRARRAPEQISSDGQEWVSLIGALFLSFWLFPGSIRALFSYRQNGRLDIVLLSLGLGLVVLLFDFAVLVNMVRVRRAHRLGKPAPH